MPGPHATPPLTPLAPAEANPAGPARPTERPRHAQGAVPTLRQSQPHIRARICEVHPQLRHAPSKLPALQMLDLTPNLRADLASLSSANLGFTLLVPPNTAFASLDPTLTASRKYVEYMMYRQAPLNDLATCAVTSAFLSHLAPQQRPQSLSLVWPCVVAVCPVLLTRRWAPHAASSSASPYP